MLAKTIPFAADPFVKTKINVVSKIFTTHWPAFGQSFSTTAPRALFRLEKYCQRRPAPIFRLRPRSIASRQEIEDVVQGLGIGIHVRGPVTADSSDQKSSPQRPMIGTPRPQRIPRAATRPIHRDNDHEI